MKKQLTALLTSVALLATAIPAMHIYADNEVTAKQMEYLDRGTVAVKVNGGVYLSWRLLGTENYDTAFDVYRDNVKIATVSTSTNYTDSTVGNKYTIVPSGKPVSSGNAVTVQQNQYFEIPLDRPDGGTSESGDYTYSPNDATPADVDGDGQYEIILKWDPSNSFDSGDTPTHSGNVYIDCYEMTGEKLWRIDLGPNINAGAHFTQMAAYDFDLDGKAELALKTAPGTKDGKGNYVSAASSISDIRNTDNSKNYKSSNGRVLSGPEYYTVFQGDTGEALDTIYYPHPRGSISEWGDSYGGRSERYLAGVAYLDGKTPSMIAWRGYYAKTTVTAFNLVNKKLVQIYDFDTSSNGYSKYGGNGNHNLAVGDVDDDGCDEILSGALALDNDLTPLWCSFRGHGDALHLADYDPTHYGMEYFTVHEHAPYGMTLYDAATGEDLFHQDAGGDTGRGVMANVGYTDGYFELWGAGNYYSDGEKNIKTGDYSPASTNFRIFWNGDLYDELLDGTGKQDSYVKIDGKDGRIATLQNVSTINSTKNNVALVADLFGDWREEIVARGFDNESLIVYTTTIPTNHKLYTLMHDSAYRMQVASQNSGYNQPAHISYYVSEDNDQYDMRKYVSYIKTVHNGETEIRTSNLPSDSPIEKPRVDKFTATKSRNEIGSEVTGVDSDKVFLNYYDKNWGLAYFGFNNITDFDPDKIKSAEIDFTAVSYATTNRDRQFYFNLFAADNSWESGTAIVTSSTYPEDGELISSTSCQTNNGNGNILIPGRAASFDITDYIKSFPKDTSEISIMAAIPSGSGGAGVCQLTMYNNPTLRITYKTEEELSKQEVNVTADADTYVIHNDSTTPFGNSGELKINQATDMYTDKTPGLKNATGLGLIRFDLSEYEDKELLSAELNIYGKYTNTDSATSALHLDYCSQDDWDENTFTASDIILRGVGTPLSSTGISQTPNYSTSYQKLSFDVTDVIKADSDNIHTFTLWTGTAREQVIASKEYTGSDAKAPTLVLTYKEAEPTPTPTASPSTEPSTEPLPSYKYNITNAVMESDGVNVNIDVTESNTKKVYGLVALYNSEKALVGMSYKEIEISPNAESFKINIENIPEYQYMTVTIWNNIDEMEPLCQLFELNK